MRAEVVSMTADNLDMEAIRRGGDILKQGGLVESAGFYENLCGERKTFG